MSEEKISQLEIKQALTDQKLEVQNEHYNRFMDQTTKVYESVNALTNKVDLMVSKFDDVSEEQKDHEKRIRKVEDFISSNKAWEKIKTSMLGATGSAIIAGVAYLIANHQ